MEDPVYAISVLGTQSSGKTSFLKKVFGFTSSSIAPTHTTKRVSCFLLGNQVKITNNARLDKFLKQQSAEKYLLFELVNKPQQKFDFKLVGNKTGTSIESMNSRLQNLQDLEGQNVMLMVNNQCAKFQLGSGLLLLDTPGVAELKDLVQDCYKGTSLQILIATTTSEAEKMLRQYATQYSNALVVLTKIDLWPSTIEKNEFLFYEEVKTLLLEFPNQIFFTSTSQDESIVKQVDAFIETEYYDNSFKHLNELYLKQFNM